MDYQPKGILNTGHASAPFPSAANRKLMYRPAEVQNLLGIRNSKFWQIVKDGLLETRKIGSATVVPADSLEAFICKLPKGGR